MKINRNQTISLKLVITITWPQWKKILRIWDSSSSKQQNLGFIIFAIWAVQNYLYIQKCTYKSTKVWRLNHSEISGPMKELSNRNLSNMISLFPLIHYKSVNNLTHTEWLEVNKVKIKKVSPNTARLIFRLTV